MALLVAGAALLGGGTGALGPAIADGDAPPCTTGDTPCVQQVTAAVTRADPADAEEPADAAVAASEPGTAGEPPAGRAGTADGAPGGGGDADGGGGAEASAGGGAGDKSADEGGDETAGGDGAGGGTGGGTGDDDAGTGATGDDDTGDTRGGDTGGASGDGGTGGGDIGEGDPGGGDTGGGTGGGDPGGKTGDAGTGGGSGGGGDTGGGDGPGGGDPGGDTTGGDDPGGDTTGGDDTGGGSGGGGDTSGGGTSGGGTTGGGTSGGGTTGGGTGGGDLATGEGTTGEAPASSGSTGEKAGDVATTPTPGATGERGPATPGAERPARTQPPAKATVPATDDGDRRDGVPAGERAGLGVRGGGQAAPVPTPAQQAAALPWGTATALPAEFLSLEPVLLPLGTARDVPIPVALLPLFQAAGAEHGVPWQVLAAINEIETGFGRELGPSSAGAVGWMQFMPGSWDRWGVDADGDRERDPADPADAIFAAARYLADHGAAHDLPGAIYAYNHAEWYVRQVLRRAREFAGLDAQVVAALTARGLEASAQRVGDPSPGQALLLPEADLRRRVLKDAEVYTCGRDDVAAGRIDRRVLATIAYLTASGLRPTVTSLECGHSVLTSSGNVSAHAYGHAVDIAAVDGKPIVGHQGPGSITERTLRALVRLQGEMRPNQLISLMTLAGHPNTIAMADHHDHVHVGFPRAAALADGD